MSVDVTVYAFEDEPEDSWHPEDDIAHQIFNLFARAALLDGLAPRLGGDDDIHRVLGEIITRAEAALNQRIEDRVRLRVNQILDDCDLVLARLRRGE